MRRSFRILRAILNDLGDSLTPEQKRGKGALAKHVRVLAERGEIDLERIAAGIPVNLPPKPRARVMQGAQPAK